MNLKKGSPSGKFVILLSKKIVELIKPYSKRIKIVGSIRRKEPSPRDIDIVLIPKDKIKIKKLLSEKGKFLEGGDKKEIYRIKGVKVELYYTTPESWGACLLAYSSRKGAGIGLRKIAKEKGYKLNQYGLFDSKGRRIAGKTEKEIYEALGRKWKPADKR